MRFRLSTILVHAAAALMLVFAANAQADDEIIDDTPSAEAMTFDLLIMRPLCLVGTVAGVAIFVVALPVNLLTLNIAEPARRLIVEPVKYTFTRELGVMN